jgi:O-antigen/teichoic acid export membrane protein
MISDTLVKIAAKGAAFLTALTFAKKFLGIIRNIILARLLAPEDFGLLALALVLIQGMDSLTFVGIDNYLIQNKKISNDLICNAWFLNIIRGLLLTLMALAVCPFYSKLVNEPATLQVLWIVAFNSVLEGMKNPGSILAEREILFGRISIYETLCAFLEVSVVIIMAWFIRDVEALAWGLLFGTLLKTLLSFFFFPILGLPRFDLTHQVELISVAKHFVVIAAGTLIMTQGDNLIIGAIEGSASLGIYVVAYQLAVFPVLFLQDIANRVAMPVFSSLQVDKDRLRAVLTYVLQIQFAVIIPFVLVAVFFAEEFVDVLYGEGWSQSGEILRFLMIVTLGKGLTHVCVPYILGTGAFSFASRMKFFETACFLGSVYIGTRHFGLVGAALGAGMGYMVAGIGRLIFICRDADLNFFSVIGYLLRPMLAAFPGILFGMLLTDAVAWHRTVETGTILVSFCICYAVFSFFMQRNLLVLPQL